VDCNVLFINDFIFIGFCVVSNFLSFNTPYFDDLHWYNGEVLDVLFVVDTLTSFLRDKSTILELLIFFGEIFRLSIFFTNFNLEQTGRSIVTDSLEFVDFSLEDKFFNNVGLTYIDLLTFACPVLSVFVFNVHRFVLTLFCRV